MQIDHIQRAALNAAIGHQADRLGGARALIAQPDFVAEIDGRLLVVHDGESWRVNAGGRLFGEYGTLRAAVLAAAGVGHILACGTQVLVQEDDGGATVVWTQGKQSYPPR